MTVDNFGSPAVIAPALVPKAYPRSPLCPPFLLERER